MKITRTNNRNYAPASPEPFKALNEITWLDNADVLQLLHVSRSTLAAWRRKKLIPFFPFGGKIYYRRSDIDEAIMNFKKRRENFKI